MTDIMAIVNQTMNADSERLRSLSQNLANVNTEGYKREVVTQRFDRLVSQDGIAGKGSNGLRVGSLNPSVTYDLSQGALKQTGQSMDIALNGTGFLQVTKDGNTYFTRKGHLAINAQGVLSLTSGEQVSASSGELRLDGTDINIDAKGQLSQGGSNLGQLDVVHFEDARQLHYIGSGLFDIGSASVSSEGNTGVQQGFVETSNVDSLAEMTALIEATRHFEASSQVLKGYDSMLDSAINTLADF
ncbi:hypothetical protein A9Q81_07590 [Gammaproteobacteria bacterium 42_54_T18]|nr:hypothetical protein A9Q81_07590 [Gammaproteobacteria bacterium 42_54_T18]